MGFKVGDRIKVKCATSVLVDTVYTVTAAGRDSVLAVSDQDGMEWGFRNTGIEHAPIPLPTPPEGREVEAEMRHPAYQDQYWCDDACPPKWITAIQSHGGADKKYHVLRPLPPKPEGEGWGWRKPVKGDECQWLSPNGEHSNGTGIYDGARDCESIRLGYRWCRAKPKVRRWTRCTQVEGRSVEFPCIDTGTGPRLDEDKIGPEWAIKWLSQEDGFDAHRLKNKLIQELESQ